ncbi:hypothetical protein J8J40_27370, partial [Mycobacterium tuberculosis]|nr:hypothetical protein [Mycobacterium tuberculosis]
AFLNGDLGVRAAEIAAGSSRDPFRGVTVDPIVTGSASGGAKPAEGQGAAPATPAAGGVQPSEVKTQVSSERPEEAKPIPGTELLSEVEILK